ncbi:SGNH/GDSL hydrolase family protein [Mycolicibacterium celeriflavum]|uniref:SGNH/GDSL hydrolase family protein n=1 Tax=Mycolicibacterium celeriflavum TaxID=1249101 RepID=UPI003CE76D06
MSRYVALGSSMAAGPGIGPRAEGAPWAAGRSARNYAHLVAAKLGFDLVDVTYSGATTANVLHEPQYGAPPQISALDGSEELVTVTIGGNDVGYVPMLFAAGLPGPLRKLPLLGPALRDRLDPQARDDALTEVAASLVEVGRTVRARAPHATVLFVDYLTLLPPSGVPAPPLPEADVATGRHVAATLERLTADAARATGCGLVRAAAHSRAHHAWSAEPWTTRFGLFDFLRPDRPAPLHPNAAGMRAVADLIVAQLTS